MKITATTLGGQKYTCMAKHYMATGDRVAFEHRFGTSTADLMKFKDHFDETGKPLVGADLSGFREEWTAFFCWRELRRHHTDLTANFDEFADNLDELKLEDPKARQNGKGPDPTVPAAHRT